ncbi:MAG TPA: hypothetical protein PKH29_11935 [Oscillospiraceae bacterium]|nr:hypothetical protein [Oscillospiraceae bacterium]
MDNTFYVDTFPGKSDDEQIASCLNEAKQQKGSTVIFRGREFIISKAIEVGSDMTVIVDDCTIKQADEAYDNVFRGANIKLDPEKPYEHALEITQLENVKILGRGKAVIEGCEKNRRGFHTVLNEEQDMTGDFWGWRTYQVLFCNAKNLEIAGLTFIKNRCWCITIDFSIEVYVHDLSIFSTVKNGDGVHFMSGCHDILVERIKGRTSDDTVAVQSGLLWFTFPFRNYLYPFTPAKCIYDKLTTREMDCHDIVIRDITSGGRHHNIACVSMFDTCIYNLTIENIRDTCRDEPYPATVMLYAGIYDVPGTLRDITVRGVHSIADTCVTTNCNIDNFLLSDLHQYGVGCRFLGSFPYLTINRTI